MGTEKREPILGKITLYKKNNVCEVLLDSSQKIEAVLSKKVIGCIFFPQNGLRVRVVFPPSPKMAKVVEVL